MNSQTARRPNNQRPARSNRSNKNRHYSRQTAHVEARRDGKPLIFGWGGHLSTTEKNRIRQRATWGLTILIALLIVGVIVGFWININIIVPSLPISTVNGHPIPQSDYRKLVAFKTQLEINKIYGPHGLMAQRTTLEQQVADQQKIIDQTTKQIDSLNKQISKLPAGPSAQRSSLEKQLNDAKKTLNTAQTQHDKLNSQLNDLTQNTIPLEQQNFTQSQIGNDSASWLQDDELIREWLAKQNKAVVAQVQPTTAQINSVLNNLKANLPTSGTYKTTYSQFLALDSVNDDDMHAMATVIARRNNMQTYLASQIKSPAYQVSARIITLSTKADADKILQQLHKGTDFATLAKQKSVDASTKNNGGYMGWLVRGQRAHDTRAAVVENWLFDPNRIVNDISPVLSENGSYDIVQFLASDTRPVDKTTLQTLKDNALDNWSIETRAMPGMSITAVDQNKLLDPMNIPTQLPASAPGQQTPTTGLPGQ